MPETNKKDMNPKGGAVILLIAAAAVAAGKVFCMERHGVVSFLSGRIVCFLYKVHGGFSWDDLEYPPLRSLRNSPSHGYAVPAPSGMGPLA